MQRPKKLRLSRTAAAEFEAIDAYSHEQFGDDVAATYMRGFGELFDLLRRHPFAGQGTPELGEGVRSLTHRSHRIFYRVRNDEIVIARILHHAMDAKKALRGAAR